MFQAALDNFPVFIGNSHSLPVTSLEDNSKFNVLNIVIEETARKYIWHKTSYKAANYLLHDLFIEPDENFEKTINVEKSDSVFSLSTKKSFNAHGKIGGELLHMVEASISADDTVSVSADFGQIDKETVDMKSLTQNLEKMQINMDLDIVKSLLDRSGQGSTNCRLCVVTETMSTSAPVTLSSTSKIQEQENLSTSMTVTPKEDEAASKSNSMTLKIPQGTVLFYTVAELYIDLEGHVKVNVDSANSLPGVQTQFNEVVLKSEYGLIFNSGCQKQILKSIISSCRSSSIVKSVLDIFEKKEVLLTKDDEFLKPILEIIGFQPSESNKLVLSNETAIYQQMNNYYECLQQLSDVSLSLVNAIESGQLDAMQTLLMTLVTPHAAHPLTSDASVTSLTSASLAWLQTVGVDFAHGRLTLDHQYDLDKCSGTPCNQHDAVQAGLHVIFVLNHLHKKSKSSCAII